MTWDQWVDTIRKLKEKAAARAREAAGDLQERLWPRGALAFPSTPPEEVEAYGAQEAAARKERLKCADRRTRECPERPAVYIHFVEPGDKAPD